MNTITNVSRRGFLTGLMGTGAFILAVRYVPKKLWAQPVRALSMPTVHSASQYLLGIDSDGTVYIVAHRSRWHHHSLRPFPWWWPMSWTPTGSA